MLAITAAFDAGFTSDFGDLGCPIAFDSVLKRQQKQLCFVTVTDSWIETEDPGPWLGYSWLNLCS